MIKKNSWKKRKANYKNMEKLTMDNKLSSTLQESCKKLMDYGYGAGDGYGY